MSDRPYEELLADPRKVVREAWAAGLRPDPRLTVSEWADRYRMLTTKDSAVAGPWRTDRTPYLREIMDNLSSHSRYRRVVLQKGTQLGATMAGNNFIGYKIDVAPGPILLVLPTIDVARRVSKQRLSTMIRACPRLAAKVKSERSRDSGNTTFSKEFEGGILMVTGSNSAAGLSSMPIEALFGDEIDRWAAEAGSEGDPLLLAEARTTNFPRRKIFLCSSPTTKGFSRIEKAYLLTDQRRYFVPCPHCGHMDWIQWSAGGYYGNQGTHHHIVFDNRDPSTARMRCSGCGDDVAEHHKTQMLERGEWRPTAIANDPTSVGYHLSALYSPLGWEPWSKLVTLFFAVKHDPVELKGFVNTRLGETWEEAGASAEPGSVLGRAREYAAEVPAGVGTIAAGVDIQADRIEVVVIGYGAGLQSWLIAHEQLWGDTAQDEVWGKLDQFLKMTFTHESGREIAIETVAIDSGFETSRVYRFCAASTRRRGIVFAVKGSSENGRDIITKPTFTNQYRVPLFLVGTDACKEVIYGGLRVAEPGPGYMHFPKWVSEEYAVQLTSEVAIRRHFKSKGSLRVWEKRPGVRNEALDCCVYALAALHIRGQTFMRQLGDRALQLARPLAPGAAAPVAPPDPNTDAPPAAPPRASRTPRRGGWIDGWKR